MTLTPCRDWADLAAHLITLRGGPINERTLRRWRARYDDCPATLLPADWIEWGRHKAITLRAPTPLDDQLADQVAGQLGEVAAAALDPAAATDGAAASTLTDQERLLRARAIEAERKARAADLAAQEAEGRLISLDDLRRCLLVFGADLLEILLSRLPTLLRPAHDWIAPEHRREFSALLREIEHQVRHEVSTATATRLRPRLEAVLRSR